MTTIGTAQAHSSAAPAEFFARWADMATWPQWNLDTEWVRLDGPFVEGGTGKLKPKGGPAVPFTIERLVPGKEFVDVSRLIGARLTFAHLVTERVDGGCDLAVTASLDGPLSRLWMRIMGAGIAKGMQGDLDRLVAVAESASARA